MFAIEKKALEFAEKMLAPGVDPEEELYKLAALQNHLTGDARQLHVSALKLVHGAMHMLKDRKEEITLDAVQTLIHHHVSIIFENWQTMDDGNEYYKTFPDLPTSVDFMRASRQLGITMGYNGPLEEIPNTMLTIDGDVHRFLTCLAEGRASESSYNKRG